MRDHEKRDGNPGVGDANDSSGLSRRHFLRDAFVGAATISIVRPAKASGQPSETRQTSLPVDPTQATETWDEPWVWRPSDFPGESLQMNIVEHENPTVVVGFGNPGAALFTYNGSTPGPTIRMKGDETLLLQLVNHLGLNAGKSPVGPAPDQGAHLRGPGQPPPSFPTGVTRRADWCLGEHTNGLHSAHTTNMHTHGLHVRPGLNPDGTHSDNIFVRLIPAADFQKRLKTKGCDSLGDDYVLEDEQVGTGRWEFRLGNVMGDPNAAHPPGTHWYHPHPHGATHNEVSSGMAGFLVVEGDVDEAIAKTLNGGQVPDSYSPAEKTGPYEYRERLMLIQRVSPGLVSADPDSFVHQPQNAAVPTVNGEAETPVITMRPGAIERWRVLNGSVDGKGYLRLMALEGQWVCEPPPAGASVPECTQAPQTLRKLISKIPQLLRVNENTGVRTVPTTAEVEGAKAHLYQLAMDGVTLVCETQGGGAEYYIKNLDFAADPNPVKDLLV